MAKSDHIWNRARADLALVTGPGEEDIFLWEHCSRVAKSALDIAELAIVQQQAPDLAALLAAALYHDAGWAVRHNRGENIRHERLCRALSETYREQGAELMRNNLESLMSADSLERAYVAVKTYPERGSAITIEAQIVAEADNLDEVGLFGFWLAVRRGFCEGKGIQSVIDQWDRRKEYQFWNARLKNGFRFNAVREVARRRLAHYEALMEEVRLQQHGSDLLSYARPTNETGTTMENASPTRNP